MAASNATVLVKAPRSRRRRLSSENQHSTRLSQDALVGVKCRWNRGRLRSQSWISLVLWVFRLSSTRCTSRSGGTPPLDPAEKGAELHAAVALLAGTDRLARLHVERGKQVDRAMATVAVCGSLSF